MGGLECGSCPRRLPLPPRGWERAHPADIPNAHCFPEAHLQPPRGSRPPLQPCPLQPPAPRSSQRCLGSLPVGRPLRSLRGSASPASFSPSRVPPRPRAAAEVTYQTPPPAPFAPDRRRERRAAPRASGRGGRSGCGPGAGTGCEGRPLLRPQLPALWLRLALTLALFPSRVMSRGGSQSWWGRAARPGPATQRGRAGGTAGASGTPATRAPHWSRPAAPHSGTVGTPPTPTVRLRWGLGPPRGWGGGVSALSWGCGAPSRAGERAGSPVWLRSPPPL